MNRIGSGISRYSSGWLKAGRNVWEKEKLHWRGHCKREAGRLGRYMNQYEDGKREV